jgi:hypothetical protein
MPGPGVPSDILTRWSRSAISQRSKARQGSLLAAQRAESNGRTYLGRKIAGIHMTRDCCAANNGSGILMLRDCADGCTVTESLGMKCLQLSDSDLSCTLGQPRPTCGILVAITVMKSTSASNGNRAM